jgi:2-polyprenyl-6-methoxyphenol hydroxylase-like FAD-dependent oxidoreductase
MYDAIVVGARVAGSPAAMLLARKGYKILLVDKASFPSDTMSTHYIHVPGVARLERWGLLDRLRATNAPPITKMTVSFGDMVISPPQAVNGEPVAEAWCPRRIILDKLLSMPRSKRAPSCARTSL